MLFKKICLILILASSVVSLAAEINEYDRGFVQECVRTGNNPQEWLEQLKALNSALSKGDNNQAMFYGSLLSGRFEDNPSLKQYPHYGNFLMDFGITLYLTGHSPDAIRYLTEAAKLWKIKSGEDSKSYNLALLWIAGAYVQQKNMFAAKEYLRKVEENGQTDKVELRHKITKALVLKLEGKKQEALELLQSIENPSPGVQSHINELRVLDGGLDEVTQEMLDEYREGKEITQENLAWFMQLTGLLSRQQATLPEAIEIGESLIEFCKERNLVRQPKYVTLLENQGVFMMRAGKYEEAKEYLDKALTLLDRGGLKNSSLLTSVLNKSAEADYLAGSYASAASHAVRNLQRVKGTLAMNLLRPENHRNKYWSDFGKWYVSTFPKYAVAHPTERNVANCYDALLIGKGMMNYSSHVFADMATQIGGDIERDYNLYVDYNDKSKNTTDIEEYGDLIEKRDKAFENFAMQMKDNPEFLQRFRFSWRDIAQNLHPGEMAIEFFNYENQKDEKVYGAVVINGPGSAPEMIYLGSGDEIESLDPKLEGEKLRKEIWDAFSRLEGDPKRVYFAPAGKLYTLPIEYFGEPGREYVRLTSTRELVQRRNEPEALESMALYGGLTYRMTPATMQAENKKYPRRRDIDVAYLRQGAEKTIEPLEKTLEEVEEISSIVSQDLKEKPLLYTGREGVEESFKALSGDSPSILHVATHGFFFDSDKDENLGAIFNINAENPMINTDMIRSGLLLAGANKAFAEGEPPEGVDDGILTALEISELDLGNTNLAVLSACETGLGSISGDGVAGLQSAFKQAGVDQLILSLWKVDDEATSELMKEFYRQWIVEKKSKHEALTNAREHIRKNALHPEWNSPDYWAAFILLDEI